MARAECSRRRFLGALPLTVLAAPAALAGAEGARSSGCLTLAPRQPTENAGRNQEAQGLGFSQPYTPAESEAVSNSPMAGIIAGLNGKGYPCSEMMLLAALRRYDLPESHVDAAAVFGGGVGKRDLCGFLTGGLMAIGIVSGSRYSDRGQLHTVGRKASNAYWDWWLSRGDLHCMGPLTTHENSEEFVRMAQRSAVKLEEVLGVLLEGGYEAASTSADGSA